MFAVCDVEGQIVLRDAYRKQTKKLDSRKNMDNNIGNDKWNE